VRNLVDKKEEVKMRYVVLLIVIGISVFFYFQNTGNVNDTSPEKSPPTSDKVEEKND